MDKIVYKPHCGKCGWPIDTTENEITYQNVYDSYNGDISLPIKVGANIYPHKCAHCGALFDSIEITPPKQLPDIHLGR